MDLKIASINSRGLGDKVERREIFNWLRQKNCQSILSKTFIVSKSICITGVIKLYSAATPAKKAGVAILFNNNFAFMLTPRDVS